MKADVSENASSVALNLETGDSQIVLQIYLPEIGLMNRQKSKSPSPSPLNASRTTLK